MLFERSAASIGGIKGRDLTRPNVAHSLKPRSPRCPAGAMPLRSRAISINQSTSGLNENVGWFDLRRMELLRDRTNVTAVRRRRQQAKLAAIPRPQGGSKWVHSRRCMFPECCSGHLLSGASSAWLRGGGAGSRPRYAIPIGPSCTTCVGPAQNGGRSTRGAQASRAPQNRTHANDFHFIQFLHNPRFHGRRRRNVKSLQFTQPDAYKALLETMGEPFGPDPRRARAYRCAWSAACCVGAGCMPPARAGG